MALPAIPTNTMEKIVDGVLVRVRDEDGRCYVRTHDDAMKIARGEVKIHNSRGQLLFRLGVVRIEPVLGGGYSLTDTSAQSSGVAIH